MDKSTFVERRITLRLLAYWEKLRLGRPMPCEADIDPDDLQDLWDCCFLVHVKDLEKPDYNYTYLGKSIEDAYRGEFRGDNAPTIASLNTGKLAGSYGKVVSEHIPVMEEGEFINLHNDLVKYRQCLLPLGENGQVEAIFGGMRFKVFPQK